MLTYQRIVITGGTGFLGRHVEKALKKAYPGAEITGLGRRDYDLLKPGQAERMLEEHKPDALIHLAAKVGGLFANQQYPAEFFYENIIMNTRTMEAARRAGVQRFLTFIGGCSYPNTASSPISEDQMWEGYPERGAASYSVAQRMNLVQSKAYRDQYGFDSSVLIPGNVYGEYDNFNEAYSHVIPALLRRFIEARESGAPSIACFGSGRPTRDFVYAGDVAATIPWFLTEYHSSEPVNISSGTRISIRDLADTIKDIVGYEGELVWDATKADGQIDKIFSVKRLNELGLSCPTSLTEGLRRTAAWFEESRSSGLVRL